jgi:hypothetical protein
MPKGNVSENNDETPYPNKTPKLGLLRNTMTALKTTQTQISE